MSGSAAVPHEELTATAGAAWTPAKRRLLTILVFALPLLILCGGAAAYLSYARTLPHYDAPVVHLPSPNAYDDYVAAGALLTRDASTALNVNAPPKVLRGILQANRPALARLREGFVHEYEVTPGYSWARPLRELSQFRILARLLLQDGRFRESDGNTGGALSRYLEVLHFATDVPHGGSDIQSEVGRFMELMTLERVDALTNGLSAAETRRALRAVQRLKKRAVPAAVALAALRDQGTLGHLEMLRYEASFSALARSFRMKDTDDWQHMLQVYVTPRVQVIREYRAWVDGMIRVVEAPYYRRPPVPPIPGDPLNKQILWNVGAYSNGWDDYAALYAAREAYWRIVETRLALRAYRLEHAGLPEKLDALVPSYLPAVPQDPFAPAPLVYRRTANGALVYSIGPDGVNDHGNQVASVKSTSKGDLVTPRPE